jgi:hypothetical protein
MNHYQTFRLQRFSFYNQIKSAQATPVNVDATSASFTSVAPPVPELPLVGAAGATGGRLGVAATVCSTVGVTVGSGV